MFCNKCSNKVRGHGNLRLCDCSGWLRLTPKEQDLLVSFLDADLDEGSFDEKTVRLIKSIRKKLDDIKT